MCVVLDRLVPHACDNGCQLLRPKDLDYPWLTFSVWFPHGFPRVSAGAKSVEFLSVQNSHTIDARKVGGCSIHIYIYTYIYSNI